MDLWIVISILAATAQTVRFMLQKHLRGGALSTAGSTFARFVYSAPIVAVVAVGYAVVSGQGVPALSPGFWAYVMTGGLGQILATMCVVALFTQRNFAVGITFKKTEVLLSAVIGFLVLGDAVTGLALVAILVGLAGVMLLSDPPKGEGAWYKRIFNRAAGLGLMSGLLFGVSAVAYRGATLTLPEGDAFYRAIVALACATAFQAAIMSAWLVWRERGEISRVLAAWRVAGLVGVTSMIGSLCWFIAFSLQTAALVKAVGQVELLFSLLAGWLVFGEVISRREWQGLALIGVSVLLLILAP